MAVRAARPVLDIENATIAADLAGRGPGAYVLRGGPGLTLTTALAEKPELDGPVVELYETNTSDKTIAVGPGYAQLMRDGQTVSQSTSLSTAFFVPLLGSDKNPFVYLKPGEKRKVGSAVLGTRSPGDYRVRAAWCHDGDGWLDVTPTYCDGSPVYRKVEGAWTGVLVSNELSVAVPASPAGR